MNDFELRLSRIIRNTEKQLGNFLDAFYLNIENLKVFEKNDIVKKFIGDLQNFWGENKNYIFGGIFLWNDIDKTHVFLGEYFSKDSNLNRNKKIKKWLFSGEEAKDIELLVKFVLKEWKNKEKVIHISAKKTNNTELINTILLESCNSKQSGIIPKLIDQKSLYSDFFKEPMVKSIIEKHSDTFKEILKSKNFTVCVNKIDEISERLAKNITLMYGYNEKWKHIYIIPAFVYVPTLEGNVKCNYPSGGLFIGSIQKIPEEMLFLFKVFITTISSHTALIFKSREMASYCLHSAISAIMGRNMSHNIGSHVMARISTGGIDGWTIDKTINEIIAALDVKTRRKDIIKWSKDVQYLSRYIQQRMDFIAQISTEWPSWTEPAYLMNDLMRWFLSQKHLLNHIAASENLKMHLFPENEIKQTGDAPKNESGDKPNGNDKPGDIRFHVFLVPVNCWDNYTCGLVGERTSDLVKDRMNFLKQDSKDPKRQSEKQLKCIPPAGVDITQDCKSCKSCRRILLFTPEEGDADCRLEEDIPLAIPGGIVGYHAFYIILENIIRNGAKHDYTKGNHDHFDVVIEVLYDPDETIGIQKGDKKKKIPAYLLRIYNNTSKMEDGLRLWGNASQKGMNNVLQTSIITDTGELNKGNWGMAEMKIAAGFLQQRNIFDIGDGKKRITSQKADNFKRLGEKESGSDAIIRAIESPIGTLGYEFYIPKPKTVGILCSEGKKGVGNGQ